MVNISTKQTRRLSSLYWISYTRLYQLATEPRPLTMKNKAQHGCSALCLWQKRMAGKSTATANNCRCYGVFYQAQQNNVLASCVLNTSNAYSATQETNENETFKL
jgi:hypothetical protein